MYGYLCAKLDLKGVIRRIGVLLPVASVVASSRMGFLVYVVGLLLITSRNQGLFYNPGGTRIVRNGIDVHTGAKKQKRSQGKIYMQKWRSLD